ncbi:AAA family ATPase [Paraburkholderia sp. IMGN_8]|uniref:AAA family ATPase n=1 Tax=Paraburkholderia sp. IMGN_8 TaxID=3136564 RepID=UPI0031010D9A
MEFDNDVNVIVGPNAIGKTTILEAVRLVKAVLAPRTQNEANQVMFGLGASSPHMPSRMNLNAVARDVEKPIAISCIFQFNESEIQILRKFVPQMAHSVVQARMGQAFANPGVMVAFVSSPEGQAQIKAVSEEINIELKRIRESANRVNVELTITANSGPTSTGSQLGPAFISVLEAQNPPNLTKFSYFPADRSLPNGEQPVQLGAADTANQLEAHNSQPQLKYARLKNTIFSALVTSDADRTDIYLEFEKIFNGVLKGRKIIGVGINEIGLLSIKIQDIESGREFDLDGMSSGEKGLILTFLLIGRSIVEGGLILLDEPELHLNPAVCKDVLPFIVDHYVKPKNLQILICSHSPEILAGAFDREECSLFHLISEKMLTKVRRQDQDTISSALRALGTSESEGLLFKGIVFVEGPDDVTILETGFGDVLRRFKLKDLGGRIEIERQIALLQTAEDPKDVVSPRFFIFDRDDAPTNLKNTDSIKILQWDWRCLENYLLDKDAIADLLMDSEVVKKPFSNAGEVFQFIKALAFNQLDESAAREVYRAFKYGDVGLRAANVKGKEIPEIAKALVARLQDMKEQVGGLDADQWRHNFEAECSVAKQRLQGVWEATWREDCDGKRLFQDIAASGLLKMSLKSFKKRVMIHMRNTQSENWRSIKSLLASLTGSTM